MKLHLAAALLLASSTLAFADPVTVNHPPSGTHAPGRVATGVVPAAETKPVEQAPHLAPPPAAPPAAPEKQYTNTDAVQEAMSDAYNDQFRARVKWETIANMLEHQLEALKKPAAK